MGSCQAVCGAATSGKGLTGRQVAAALKYASKPSGEEHEERSKLTEDAENEQEGNKREGDTVALEHITEEKCRNGRRLSVLCPYGNGKEPMNVYEYAPDVFYLLRKLDGFDKKTFADEWDLPNERQDLELSEGRSMALFLESKSKYLLCKIIAKVEVDVLLHLLPRYAKHFREHSNTLLMRFYMLLRVEFRGELGYVLCFGDVFAPCRTLNEKWDLKGRRPKPGKYKHFAKLFQHPYDSTTGQSTTPGTDTTQYFPSGTGISGLKEMPKATDKNKLATKKDKDLTRYFWLDKEQREKLLLTLRDDCKFLASVGLMDYSLLIGVAYEEKGISNPTKRLRSMRMPYPRCGPPEGAMENRPEWTMTCGGECKFSKGIFSLYNQEVYYIGVIDVLTPYTFKKKLAKLFKSFLWRMDTLSTIPPLKYCERILQFTEDIFRSHVDGKIPPPEK
ncbi:phosphatidylinositol-4-phosphate 5-kinase, putative [Trypanosoma equiperdum]|uniref:Phosphatidylinositol-4-phosphate 5-kinase, putative n=1 Tax=Trypanosoma equiperdum TaxID=5694 RepID=A0A1G4I6C6_TRYEQ|nr:phosphatidylinositol-4-phosphate 5-kinase, putative [Trypanosoma equiperdum]